MELGMELGVPDERRALRAPRLNNRCLHALAASRRGASMASRERIEALGDQAVGQVSFSARLLSQSFCAPMASAHEAPSPGPSLPRALGMDARGSWAQSCHVMS